MKMTKEQKEANMNFFEWALQTTNEGGVYHWPNKGFDYTIKNGCFVAPKKELVAIAKITPKAFHKKLKVGPSPTAEQLDPTGKSNISLGDDIIMEMFGLDEDKPSNQK